MKHDFKYIFRKKNQYEFSFSSLYDMTWLEDIISNRWSVQRFQIKYDKVDEDDECITHRVLLTNKLGEVFADIGDFIEYK